MSNFAIAPEIPLFKKNRAKIIKKTFEISDIFEYRSKEKNILITGQVQSGKTRWIIEIIKEAILKHHYNLIIVIGGYNKKLLEQTQGRLEKELQGINAERHNEKLFEVKKWDNNSSDIIWNNQIYNVLKNSKNIKGLKKKLKRLTFKPKILVIDDECDFFSINNKNNKDKNEKLTIYRNLKELYNIIDKFDESIYINVTATPFANIINNYDKDFNIQALYTLPIKLEYKGFDYFINKNSDKHFIRSDDFFIQDDEIKYARIITYWLIQTIRYFKETNNNKSEMIIFEDIEIEQHQKTKDFIINSLSKKELYIKIFNEIKNKYFINESINQFEFEQLLLLLKQNGNSSILVLNKETKDENNEINITKIPNKKELKIYIGGNLLSRGLTFEHLILEYFNYLPKSVTYDTLLQRCRWFGYRDNNKLLEYLKIICDEKTLNELKSCLESVEFFFNNETINGSKLDLDITREKVASIKKSTSELKKG